MGGTRPGWWVFSMGVLALALLALEEFAAFFVLAVVGGGLVMLVVRHQEQSRRLEERLALLGPLAGLSRPRSSAEAEARSGVVWFSRIGALLILVSAIVGYTLLENSLAQALIGWAAGVTVIATGLAVRLDAPALGVAWHKRWTFYNYVVFAVTWVIYSGWHVVAYRPADAGWAFLFTTAFFIVFAGVSILHNVVHRALFAFALAATYGAIGYLTIRRNVTDRMLQLSFLGLAAIFLTVAFPVALDGPWVTVAWALEGASLVWIGFSAGSPEARGGGLVIFGLTAIRLVAFETYPDLIGMGALPGGPLRAFTFTVSVAAYYLGAWAYARFGGDRRILAALAVAANLFTLWYITLEISLAYVPGGNARIAAHEAMAVATAWGLYGLLLALMERRAPNRHLRAGARVVFAAALLILTLGALTGNARWAIAAYRYAGYGGVLGGIWAAEYLFRRTREEDEEAGILSLAAAAVSYYVCHFEVTRWLEAVYTLPHGVQPTYAQLLRQEATRANTAIAVWGLYGLAVAAAGAWLRSRQARLLASALFGITLLFVLSKAPGLLTAHPALRAAAFTAAVAGAYLAAYLGQQAAGPDAAESRLHGIMALGAAVLTAIWVGSVVEAPLSGGLAARAVTAFGAVYGLAVVAAGLWLRSASARWLGLGFIALANVAVVTQRADDVSWPMHIGAYAVTAGAAYAAAWLLRRQSNRVYQGIAVATAALAVPWLAITIATGRLPAHLSGSFLLSAAWAYQRFGRLIIGDGDGEKPE